MDQPDQERPSETSNEQPTNFKNLEYINSDWSRPVKVLQELTSPSETFQKEEIFHTIVFFGSARSRPMEEAKRHLESLEELDTSLSVREIEAKLQHARMQLKLSEYYEDAVALAKVLTEWSLGIVQKEKRFYICSGGGPGMMEAANRGASEAGGDSIGLNIHLPFEQVPNPYQTKRLSFDFNYFFIRKFWFAYMAKCLVVFPGGYGTMDELFELLTLIQTNKLGKKIPIILYGKEFWQSLINFEQFVRWGVINPEDVEMMRICDSVEESFEYIKSELTERFLS